MAPVHQPIIVNCYKFSLDVRALYLWHCKPVIGDSAVYVQLIKPHICLTPTQSQTRWYQFNCLVNRDSWVYISSLSKAISQISSSQDSNSQPSDHKSRTPTTRPRTMSPYVNQTTSTSPERRRQTCRWNRDTGSHHSRSRSQKPALASDQATHPV